MAIRNRIIASICCVMLALQLQAQEQIDFWTLFDSLGSDGQWQYEFAQSSGWNFHPGDDAKHPVSAGGTSTAAYDTAGSLVRAKNLVNCYPGEEADIIFFENVNDIHSCSATSKPAGSVSDAPWMPKESLTIHAVFGSRELAQQWVQDSLITAIRAVDNAQRDRVNYVTIPYCTPEGSGTRITFITAATQEGDCIIRVANRTYGVHVTPEMTIQEIVNKVTEWHFGSGWVDIDNGDGSVTFSFWTTTEDAVTFDDNGTGITVSVSPDTKNSTLRYYYKEKDASHWEEPSQWTSNITLYSTYKGMFGYLKEQLPDAQVFLFIPTYYNLDFSDQTLRNADGTFNAEAVQRLEIMQKWQHLKEFWHEICEACGIEILDIESRCGIRLDNIENYYYSNDVHPKPAGYSQWAKTLLELLQEMELLQTPSLNGKDQMEGKTYSIDGKQLRETPRSGLFIKDRTKIYKM